MTTVPDRECVVCGRASLTVHEPQTCASCVTQTRHDLRAVERLTLALSDELASRAGARKPMNFAPSAHSDIPLPGGEGMVLLAPGSMGTVVASRDGDRSHANDHLPSDSPSVIAFLAGWEDVWRQWLGQPATLMLPTLAECVGFLVHYLPRTSQHHPAFAEFARELHALRERLERVSGEGTPREWGAVPCPGCSGRLRREYRPRKECQHVGSHCDHSHVNPRMWGCGGTNTCGCDQGGRSDPWVCRARDCGRVVQPWEYWLAVRQVKQTRLTEGG